MLEDEIAAHFVASGPTYAGVTLSTTTGTPNLYTVPLTDGSPDPAVSVVCVGGGSADRAFSDSLSAPVAEHPIFQVLARGSDGALVRSLAHELSKQVENLGPVTLSGVAYRDVRLLAPSHFIRLDPEDRYLYAFEAEAMKDRS